MNGRYDSEDLEDVHEGPPAADREISLGTGAMLGIFLALVLVCGAFFGFGYSMGHKTGLVVPPGAAVADPETAGPAASGEMKPLPGSSSVDAPEVVVKPSAGSGVRAGAVPRSAKVDTGADAPTTPIAGPPQGLKSGAKPYITASAAPPSMAATIPAVAGAAAGSGAIFVQISAVSHQEDAQLLMTALKRRGYEATVRHSSQDQLLHVQMGPYATKKDADAMRQRLSADGYNAILK